MFKLLNQLKLKYNRDLVRIGYQAYAIHAARHPNEDSAKEVSRTSMLCSVAEANKDIRDVIFGSAKSWSKFRHIVGLNDHSPSDVELGDIPDFDVTADLKEGIRSFAKDFSKAKRLDLWGLSYACLSGTPGRLVSYLEKMKIPVEHTRDAVRKQLQLTEFRSDQPRTTDALIGRDSLIHELNEAFESPEIRVAGVFGVCGSGKTSLVRHWTDELTNRNKVRIYWMSTWERDDTTGFRTELLSQLDHNRKDAREVSSNQEFFERLTRALDSSRRTRHVLVIDEIERTARSASSESIAFFRQLVDIYSQSSGQSLCVLVGVEEPFPIPDSASFLRIVVGPLSEDAATYYLQSLGVVASDNTLARIVNATSGVPRALQVVAQRIATHSHADLDHASESEFQQLIGDAIAESQAEAERVSVDTIANFNPDIVHPDAPLVDQLGIDDEVNAISSVVVSKTSRPPLAVGLFGDWGSGKSFFMNMMRERIRVVSAQARKWRQEQVESAYCSDVIQITFNAWHYVDTNLWASLVTHIFEQMAEAFGKRDGLTPEKTRQKLFENVESAKGLLKEAKKKRELVAEEVDAAREELDTIENKESEVGTALSQLLTPSVLKAAVSNESVANLLKSASLRLGVDSSDIEQVRLAAQEVRTLSGRVWRLIERASGGDWKKRVLILCVFVAGPLVVSGLAYWVSNRWSENSDFVRWASVIGGTVALVAQFLAVVRPHLIVLAEGVKRFEQADSKLDELISEERERREQQRFDFQQQLLELGKKEELARQRISKAEMQLREAEEELKEISIGRRLYRLLGELSNRDEYRGHLGLVSTIRGDLKALSELLVESAESDAQDSLPRVDRIVLYIDDLDRCPSSKVVEVLQAVHLMMAFELFVVVVGVDARWLLHSLQNEYATFRGAEDDSGEGRIEAEWITTPQHYLEKIFQIPFAVRPMTDGGYQQLMETLLPVELDEVRESASESSLATTEQDGDGEKAEATTEDEIEGTADVDFEQGPSESESLGEIPVNPEQLRVKTWELRFINELGTFVPSPRAAKRFANIYSLIRAMIPSDKLARFEGARDGNGEYQIAAILLAMLSGYPDEAHEVFHFLISRARPEHGWKQFVVALRPIPFNNANASTDAEDDHSDSARRFRNLVSTNITPPAASSWSRLCDDLERQQRRTALPDSLEPFIRLASSVARFSFKSGRAISTL